MAFEERAGFMGRHIGHLQLLTLGWRLVGRGLDTCSHEILGIGQAWHIRAAALL